jgi:arginyl-tRNA synthetase
MIKHELENEIKKVAAKLYTDADIGGMKVERAENFGDYSTNVALVLAGKLKKSPQEIAKEFASKLMEVGLPSIEKLEVAGVGFINIIITEEAVAGELDVLSEKLKNGFDFVAGQKLNIEFISANPTGDLHIGHGRGAFYGDILSNTLVFAGAEVTREFYINDSRESNQIKELGKTAIGEGEQYKTPRLEKMIKDMDFKSFSEAEAGFVLAGKVQEYNKTFIEQKLGIIFDNWYSEDEKIRAVKAADKVLEELKKREFVYEKDVALWIKTSEYGDDEDRVVVRSDDTATYFVSDIAYHKDKFCRGYDKVFDVWGADHHGHVKRMHAVGKMLGWPQEPVPQPIIFITQLVSLKEAGERKKMSKRAGTAILLEDLVDEFGIDVVRWFFAEKSLSTHMDFDAELAKEQSQKNPVYYVQYAHARIASVFEKTKDLKSDKSSLKDILKEERGKALAMKISEFSEILENISKNYQVHKLTTYAHELASEFSQFYRDVRIITDGTYRGGALELASIAKNTLAKTLSLLGISAPDRM